MDRKQIESFFFLGLLLGTLVLAFFMIRPYLTVLVVAAILAVVFSGITERLTAAVGSRTLAAFLATLLVLCTVLIPLTLAGFQIAREAAQLTQWIDDQSATTTLSNLAHGIQGLVGRFIPGISITPSELRQYTENILSWLISHIGTAFAGAFRLVVDFILVLLFFFYLVRDGKRLKARLMELSPLADQHEAAIIARVAGAINATIRGQIVLALLQGLLSGIGFAIFGLPNAALWGAAAALAAFIPNIGTSLVILPSVLFLWATASGTAAIGLAFWGMLAVGLIDNYLSPKLIGSGTKIHPLIIMLSVLGGLALFGPIGFLVGPIVATLLFALFDIWIGIIRPEYAA